MTGEIKTPKVLHREVFPGGGPYVEFYSFETPLFHPFGPPATEHQRGLAYGLFLELADDLLGSLCRITRHYSPFDPHGNTYYVPNLTRFKAQAREVNFEACRINTRGYFPNEYGLLTELRDPVVDWRRRLLRVNGETIRWTLKFHYDPVPAACELRADLVAAMDFLLEKIDEARECGNTISVIGF